LSGRGKGTSDEPIVVNFWVW